MAEPPQQQNEYNRTTAIVPVDRSASFIDASFLVIRSKWLLLQCTYPTGEAQFLRFASMPFLPRSRVAHAALSLAPHSLVQVARRKQIFTFLLEGSTTIGEVKTKLSAVAAQHDLPEASEDARLLLADGKAAADDATLASLDKNKSPEGLSFHLVYSIGDDEYEPVEVEPTRQAA